MPHSFSLKVKSGYRELNETSCQEDLSSLVILSNSIPKSASTLMCSLQTQLLQVISKDHRQLKDRLPSEQFEMVGRFVVDPHSEPFLEWLSQKHTQGPYIFKVHALMSERLLEIIETSHQVFTSLCIRDPIETFFSARDNFRKTGEFAEFENKSSGIRKILTHYRAIWELHKKIEKSSPIIDYRDIVESPLDALRRALPESVKQSTEFAAACEGLDIEKVNQSASHRFNYGHVSRGFDEADSNDFNFVAKELETLRKDMGYLP